MLKVYKYLEKKPFLSPKFYEIANTILSFYYGKFEYLKTNHLIRLNNSKQSFSRNYKKKSTRSYNLVKNIEKIELKDSENLIKFIERKFQIKESYSKKLIFKYSNTRKIPKTIIINLIHRMLVLIKLDLNDIKSIFNLYYLFSNKNK